jgi:putative transposase
LVTEELVVAVLERHGVVPDLGGHVDHGVQVLKLFAAEELEPEGLTHGTEPSKMCLLSQPYRHKATTVFLIHYHFVWCPKRRRKVLVGPVAKDLQSLLAEKAADLGSQIVALEILPDHVHLVLSCPPRLSPSDAMFWLKGYTSRVLRERYAHLARMTSLWTRSFFVSTAGNVSSETIERYIAEQKTR